MSPTDVYKRQDMVYKFSSTSKISFPGSGVAAISTSYNNLKDIKKQMAIQTIGHDKLNQLRHVRYFKDLNGIMEHMKKHAEIMRPKFEAVLDTLDRDCLLYTSKRGGFWRPCHAVNYGFDKVECRKFYSTREFTAAQYVEYCGTHCDHCLLYTSRCV